MFTGIRNSHLPFADRLDAEERNFLERLPRDYREFLQAHNGGFVEEYRLTFLTGVPFRTETVDNPSREDCPVEFFGIPMAPTPSDHPDDLLQVFADHRSENLLPRDVLAIARCVQNSLVCISLRSEDSGSIYYWDWYWRYPWCKSFFDARIAEAAARFDDVESVSNNPSHPRYEEVSDAVNFATLVKLAGSFSEWIARCEDRRAVD